LPGSNLDGILELRTIADADKLKKALTPGIRLAVVSGGYIGLEVAASVRSFGAHATIIEREPRVLARVASPRLSGFFEGYHRARGVSLELSTEVKEFIGAHGRVEAIRLSDERVTSCDVALIGVGTEANVDLARRAGLECNGGIVVDLRARTSDPFVYAVGDCTVRPLPFYNRMARLESVPNAVEQAKQAARDICGRSEIEAEVPWFWSDQFDVKLQIAGLIDGAVETVIRGDYCSAQFTLFHLNASGQVLALKAVNSGADFVVGRRLISKGLAADRNLLEDSAIPIACSPVDRSFGG
jgi:3-phenylpropionate/trans-cinnamate dioxygenase ferredoxin reductase subunit